MEIISGKKVEWIVDDEPVWFGNSITFFEFRAGNNAECDAQLF